MRQVSKRVVPRAHENRRGQADFFFGRLKASLTSRLGAALVFFY